MVFGGEKKTKPACAAADAAWIRGWQRSKHSKLYRRGVTLSNGALQRTSTAGVGRASSDAFRERTWPGRILEQRLTTMIPVVFRLFAQGVCT